MKKERQKNKETETQIERKKIRQRMTDRKRQR
jgi:hypothetical protein